MFKTGVNGKASRACGPYLCESRCGKVGAPRQWCERVRGGGRGGITLLVREREREKEGEREIENYTKLCQEWKGERASEKMENEDKQTDMPRLRS